MPELPEINNIARQMDERLAGKTILDVDVKQEKCLNMPLDAFKSMVVGKAIDKVGSRGKWIVTELSGETCLMISLGMNGDILYHTPGEEYTDKYQYLFRFTDGSSFHIRFAWFGYVHAADRESLPRHGMTASLGDDPLSDNFTRERFRAMLKGRKGGIKSFLMNQHNIAGIGNVYIQDILFKSRLHPNRKIESLSDAEKDALHDDIVQHLQHAKGLGGLVWERDFYGNPGRYEYSQVGHRPGAPCPVCGTPVKEIRTGSTRSYICENCQRL
jgi:formamidopyrimidine-DNA glycosylase